MLDHKVSTFPQTELSWSNDVFGNAIASATFQTRSDSLVVDSSATVDLTASAWPVFDIAASAINYPFLYAHDPHRHPPKRARDDMQSATVIAISR